MNRIPVVLASLNEDLSIADFEIQVRNLVRDVEVAYWNLYVAYRNVSTAVIGRNSAIATAKFAKFNFDKGIGTKQELAQAEEQYYNPELGFPRRSPDPTSPPMSVGVSMGVNEC